MVGILTKLSCNSKDRSGSFPSLPEGSFPSYEPPPVSLTQQQLPSIVEESSSVQKPDTVNRPNRLSKFLCRTRDRPQDASATTISSDDDMMPLLDDFAFWNQELMDLESNEED